MVVASIAEVRELSKLDHGLATLATVRDDGFLQLTVVNAGIVTHPVSGADVGAFVTLCSTRKLAHLRARPRATLLWRAGWLWVALEGRAEICGPDDALDGVTESQMRELLRQVVRASGMERDDWDEYDRIVAAERRPAVLVTPRRIYRNP